MRERHAMKAIMLMFDSLNRHMLPVYGCDWTKAPNFQRLAEKTVTFETSFVGSMPCMPARREIHTGRYNFLHRSWGPLEPFDDSMPEILKRNGVHTHLATDHYHYWEEGGCTYHTRYSNFQVSRGQEGDKWKGDIGDPDFPYANKDTNRGINHQDWVNRAYMQDEQDQPQAKTFKLGMEYIDKNKCEFGAELSGHLFFKKFKNLDNPDIALIYILKIIAMHLINNPDKKFKFSDLISKYKIYHKIKETNIKDKKTDKVIRTLKKE